MAKKPNYGWDKRRKEQDRKAKKDAKALERQQRRGEQSPSEPGDPLPTTDAPGSSSQIPPDGES